MPTGWRIICESSASGPRPWWRSASSARREMIVGLLGILKAGGAYLPLDAGYPRERLEFMLADAGVAVLVTQSALVDRLPVSTTATPLVRLDADAPAIARQPDTAPLLDIDPRHPAYVIYTSGSTGAPKAVVVEHASLTNKMLALGRDFGVDRAFPRRAS